MMRAVAPDRAPDGWSAPQPRAADAADDALRVEEVLGGRREAFSVLVHRHQAEMFRYARGMDLDYDAASDVVQDAFVIAYQRLRQCRDPRRFRQWLMRIVRNHCVDHHRDIRRKTAPLAAVTGGTWPKAELRRIIGQALGSLSPRLRDAFLLKYHGRYTYEEMAAMARTTPSAMKMRVQRARAELRSYLEDAGLPST